MRGRIEAAGQQKRQRPAAVLPQQAAGAVPFQRAGRKKLRKQPVLPGLAPVAVAAQPAQVLRREGSEHCGWAQRTRHLYCQSVIDLIGLAAAYLAERFLNLLRMLAGCDAVCVQAVAVPARPDVGGRLVAPATDAVAGGSAHLAVRLTSLLGWSEGCRLWCSTRPRSWRCLIGVLMCCLGSDLAGMMRACRLCIIPRNACKSAENRGVGTFQFK